MAYCTYILASKKRGTLYVGVTNDLPNRVLQHKAGTGSTFTRRYNVHRLVYYEQYDDVRDAIQREKSLKRYARAWKINLIEENNPDWRDMSDDFTA
jgi:putative endonuclease